MTEKIKFHREFAYLCGRIVARRIDPLAQKLAYTGSFRRRSLLCGDIDILIIPKQGVDEREINEAFASLCIDGKLDTSGSGMSKGSVNPDKNMPDDKFAVPPVNIFFTTENEWGAALMYTTGCKEYNIGYRARSKKHYGLTVNQYGVFREGNLVPGSGTSEQSMCRAMHIPWLDPPLRNSRQLFPRFPVTSSHQAVGGESTPTGSTSSLRNASAHSSSPPVGARSGERASTPETRPGHLGPG